VAARPADKAMMSPPVPIALLGFTAFERQRLEPGLATLRRRKPAYAPREHLPAGCNLLVVDADNEQACRLVSQQQRLGCTLMIGNTHHPGAAAHLPRPIQVGAVLEALDELLAQAPAMSAEVAKVHATLAALLARGRDGPVAVPAATDPKRPPVAGPNPPVAAPSPVAAALHATPAVAAATASPRGSALLVAGESATAALLQRTLQGLGLAVERAASGTQAMQWLQSGVVVDYVLLTTSEPGNDSPADTDGFHTCKLLQRLPPAQVVAPPPTLVMLLGSDMLIDRLRAERAGADAWLTPPWDEAGLLKVIDERERWLASLPRREA
jgi:CheY-like chemotaxis protein